ncbi:acyl-CoA dehydrogenase family protein [Rhodococcus sp. IEGM1300]
MDFTFNDDQLAFREAISRFLMTEAAPEMLREIWETDIGRSRDLRNKIAEQGLTALSVPEAEGGMGMDDVTWALMTQELGYYAIPDSLADTAYVASGLLASLKPEHPARANLLPRIADGSLRLAISHPVNALVSDAQLAEVLILTDGDDIHVVPRSQVDVENHPSIDASRRLGHVTWNPSPETLVASDEQGAALQKTLLDRGALSVAGQLLGLAQRMLDLSVDYVAQRKQFGKPIGSFQAVKHHLADVARCIENAKPVLYRAAHALARGDSNASVWVSQARLAANEASWIAARKGIQVHGAMGYTWEVDLQMFMKRAWALDATWGDRGFHKNRVGDYVFANATGLGPGHTFEE